MEPEGGSEKAPKVPDSVIRAALLRRAVEDIHRIIQIRTAKASCTSLLQRGSVGDDLWQRFQRAEKEMEEELRDVVMEVRRAVPQFPAAIPIKLTVSQANALAPNWGQIIFQSANEILANSILKERLDEIQAQTEKEKEWWEKRRTSIKTEFMKELGDDTEKVTSGDEPVLVDTNTPSGTPFATPSGASKKKKGKK